MDNEELLKKMRQGAFAHNNRVVLNVINIERHGCMKLQDASTV